MPKLNISSATDLTPSMPFNSDCKVCPKISDADLIPKTNGDTERVLYVWQRQSHILKMALTRSDDKQIEDSTLKSTCTTEIVCQLMQCWHGVTFSFYCIITALVSTQILIFSLLCDLGATAIGLTHGVGPEAFSIIP